MGVTGLWRALGSRTIEGAVDHEALVAELEGKVVAIDLSAWLVQSQTQPALDVLDSAYARAVKVVFDRVIHWLRYGVTPVFVIEGETPPAKLAKLRARAVAQYGPRAAAAAKGNRAGCQFDRLGQAVKRLLDAFGIPCVQASGEGEATAAALNQCGWVDAVATSDVDALLFGAATVLRQVHLSTDAPAKSCLSVARLAEVQRLLGLARGGDAALVAVAQLAGGDYDASGADHVGESMALGAVRCLLKGCQDDSLVLAKLEAALAAGPDPELDALTCCTGCKACGHEGGLKGRIKAHTKRHGGCPVCGLAHGCVARQWTECACAFHARSDERLLNRVVRRARQTPGFLDSCRAAAATYAQQTRAAMAAVQAAYGQRQPGAACVFAWAQRPDVRRISAVMTKYMRDWSYGQVRLKLLPLLLEWDVRQGPSPPPSAGVQLRPTAVRKVSGKAAAPGQAGMPSHEQRGWRYVLRVQRLPGPSPAGGHAAAAAAGGSEGNGDEAAEDLAIDQAWIAGTARSKPPKPRTPVKQPPGTPGAPTAAAAAGAEAGPSWSSDPGFLLGGPDDDEAGEPPALDSQLLGLSQAGSQAAAVRGEAGGAGTLAFGEHRSVRCSLLDAAWPELVAAFRAGPKGRRGGAARKKAPAAAAPAAAAGPGEEGGRPQLTVKDFFGVVKDYAAPARPAAKPLGRAAPAGGSIPGLAGLAGGAAAPGTGRPVAVVAAAAAGAADASGVLPQAAPPPPQQQQQSGFLDWLDSEVLSQPATAQQQRATQVPETPAQGQQTEHHQRQGSHGWGLEAAAAAAAGDPAPPKRVFVGVRSGSTRGGAAAAAAPGRPRGAWASTGGAAGCAARSSRPGPMPPGALDRYLQPQPPAQASAAPATAAAAAAAATTSSRCPQPLPASPPGAASPPQVLDCTQDSPDLLPLAARIALAPAAAAGSPAKRRATERARQQLASPPGADAVLPPSQAGAATPSPGSGRGARRPLFAGQAAGGSVEVIDLCDSD